MKNKIVYQDCTVVFDNIDKPTWRAHVAYILNPARQVVNFDVWNFSNEIRIIYIAHNLYER